MTAASTLMHRLRAENGSAIVVAMGAMSVILLLSAWTAGASTQLSGSSERDRSAKRALPATEGAIRQANYKLNNLKPGPTECPDGFTADGAWCRGSADPAIGLNAGNGVVFDYWLTKANPGGTCAGFPVRANLQLEVRCVTAQATANGVVRRAQARLVRPTGASLFPFPGLFGDKYVKLKNNTTVGGALGSNELLEFDNNTCVSDGLKIGTPGGRVLGTATNGSGCSSAVTYNTSEQGPFVLTPVDFKSTHLENDNEVGWGPPGSFTYDATRRSLSITGSGFTFYGGDYNLCSLNIEGGTIYIPSGEVVRIFMDSRTEAGCTGGGSIIGNNAVTFVNPGAADHLQIFLNGAGPVEFNNEFTMNGYLHAPNAAVRFKNANGGVANITGGIAARTIDAKNSLNFTTPICVIDGVSQDCPPPVGETESIFYRTAWIECSPTRAVAPDPTSGC
ncbi:MAG: hypothetical protein H0U20_05230 [Thermoleophilaceae bacterium]|nr:hypothetical protein [Thermoleophilaceae bacterium]